MANDLQADDRDVPGVEPYDGPAGGWGALKAVALAIKELMGASADTRALLQMNLPDGFDCPAVVALKDHDPESGTPSYKSVRVTMRAAA